MEVYGPNPFAGKTRGDRPPPPPMGGRMMGMQRQQQKQQQDQDKSEENQDDQQGSQMGPMFGRNEMGMGGQMGMGNVPDQDLELPAEPKAPKICAVIF